MEKKTIGKFIAILRKANGMTQKELGEKLLVSDKTVSRWENDEFSPDISLLPAIAEIFGITTDELLRGERNNPEREGYGSAETIAKQKAKSDKQFSLMLDKKSSKYTALTCVSLAITVIGMLLALLFRTLSGIVSAIILTSVFSVVAEICQIVFAIEAFIKTNDDDGYLDKTTTFNKRVVSMASWFSIFNLTVPVHSILIIHQISGPIVGRERLLGNGTYLGLAVAHFVILYIIYVLAVYNPLVKKGLITRSEIDKKINEFNSKLLKKMTLICGIIAILLLGVGHVFIIPEVYYNQIVTHKTFATFEEFKEYTEGRCDDWCEAQKDRERFWYENEQGELVFDEGDFFNFCNSQRVEGFLEDDKGHVYEYYYLYNEEPGILSYEKSDNEVWNIKVFDAELAEDCVSIVKNYLGIIFILYFGICAVIYKSLTKKNAKKILLGTSDNNGNNAEETIELNHQTTNVE